jgi:glycosyltransferase involved in cell wall biosynthesis
LADSQPPLTTAVVIPCYKVSKQLAAVVAAIPQNITRIYCVNDCCPENSTDEIEQQSVTDQRLKVLKREVNGGVGAAMVTGYQQAVMDGVDIVVKLDGDGQMDPAMIPLFVSEIAEGRADYVKGNRFYSFGTSKGMPLGRKIGNMGLSFMTKMSTGYWQLFDPTNGFTAIHINILKALPLQSIDPRYFFESDMLFHLGLLRARIVEVPMRADYGDEDSHLSQFQALRSFPIKHARNLFKRIIYDYFLRNFSIASLELLVGLIFLIFGLSFGISAWSESSETGQAATAGTVMLAALPSIIGIQFILNFIAFDMAREPTQVVHNRLRLYR